MDGDGDGSSSMSSFRFPFGRRKEECYSSSMDNCHNEKRTTDKGGSSSASLVLPFTHTMTDNSLDHSEGQPSSWVSSSAPIASSPPVGLLSGLLSRIRSDDEHDSYASTAGINDDNMKEDSVHGDLVISHDEHGVYLTSKPDHSSDTLSVNTHFISGSGVSDRGGEESQLPRPTTPKPSLLPKFMQHLFVFPNFVKLGSVYICKTNPAWGSWEKRRLFLWDNYVFETLPNDDGVPVGFANMSGAIVQLKTDACYTGTYD